ncbi:UNVERIFIED_ORG: hypothetical protein [Escherichia phage CMSTMSU]
MGFRLPSSRCTKPTTGTISENKPAPQAPVQQPAPAQTPAPQAPVATPTPAAEPVAAAPAPVAEAPKEQLSASALVARLKQQGK